MNAVPLRKRNGGLFETTGIIKTHANGVLEVGTSEGTFHASRAVSCLVTPEDGDLVILAGSGSDRLYVLAVLERTGNADARISTEGNLTLELQSGRFTVCATDGVDLITKNALSVVADRVEARAREGSLFLRSASMIVGTMDATLERLSQTVKRAYRRVTELEHVRAGQIDYAADGNLRLHGENTLMTARELVKADAKQIHIG